MTTYQETKVRTASTQEDMNVRYIAKTLTRAVGADATPAVMMAA